MAYLYAHHLAVGGDTFFFNIIKGAGSNEKKLPGTFFKGRKYTRFNKQAVSGDRS